MQWDSVSEFFAMGGYAVYVWGSYAVTAAAIALEVWLLARRARTPGGAPGPRAAKDLPR